MALRTTQGDCGVNKHDMRHDLVPIQSNYKRKSVTMMRYNATQAMKARRDAIRSLCNTEKYRGNFGAGQGHSSIISTDHKSMIYCPVPKAGWSTWKRLFYREHGVEHLMNDTLHLGFQSQWSKAGLMLINNRQSNQRITNRMVFVRNPYDRLVSAYSFKIIQLSSRGPCKPTEVKPGLITFPQFVQCVIARADEGHQTNPKGGYGGQLDYHYRPQTLLCDFCSTDYNIIGHTEHMDEDIIESLKVLNMTYITSLRENASPRNNNTLSYWYSQMSGELLEAVQGLYSKDFELLGYSKDTFTRTAIY
ncbi:carbohydrate sulfotransferase 12-like [Watersipora subatra]|uniref:carbohydrate sulfotransferase 12-like n=1 Tax=Watersipora subatra TaxID=2589382 RepID=UPI00355C70D1